MMGSFAYDVALGKQGFFPWFLGPLVGPGGLGTMGLAKGRLTNSRHRFWAHKSATESLVFHGWADPQEKDRLHILDENFLRNLQGYLADCHKADLKPSIFQLVLFSYEASTLATPPFWVPLWFLTGLNHVLACWIAARLLGYVLYLVYPFDVATNISCPPVTSGPILSTQLGREAISSAYCTIL